MPIEKTGAKENFKNVSTVLPRKFRKLSEERLIYTEEECST